MNVEDKLYPNHGVLEMNKQGTLTSKIFDEEIDMFDLEFNNDNCVKIDTDGCNYIVLSIEKLYKLIHLIEDSNKLYSIISKRKK